VGALAAGAAAPVGLLGAYENEKRH
jgi:hypothetical protein